MKTLASQHSIQSSLPIMYAMIQLPTSLIASAADAIPEHCFDPRAKTTLLDCGSGISTHYRVFLNVRWSQDMSERVIEC